MTTVADFITNDPTNGKFRLRAGEAITKDDLLLLNYEGLAYKATNTVAASVSSCTYGTAQTTEDTGRIIAETVVCTFPTLAFHRNAMVVDDEGSIFTLSNYSATGLRLTKYSSSGALAGYVNINTAAWPFYSHHIFLLSNGNIACVSVYDADRYIYYSIYTPDLITVKSHTALTGENYDFYFSACALSDGGFAVVYTPKADGGLPTYMMAVSNAGDVVLPQTTIWTRIGTTSNVARYKIAQLSNGNIAVACLHYTVSSAINGHVHGVVTVGGAIVSAFASVDAATSQGWIPELSVLPGYYCMAAANGSQQKAYVFNNAGVLQGGAFSYATTEGDSALATKLVHDGVDFYLIWQSNQTSQLAVTKIPLTGTNYVTSLLPIDGLYNNMLDAFCERGLIIVGGGRLGSGYSARICAIDKESLLPVGNPMYIGLTTNAGLYPRLLPLGDFSFVYMDHIGSNAATIIIAGKYANAVIIGTAYESAAEGELVRVNGSAGAYVCNPMIGAISKSFDHSASNIVGNKGTIMPNSVALKGI